MATKMAYQYNDDSGKNVVPEAIGYGFWDDVLKGYCFKYGVRKSAA